MQSINESINNLECKQVQTKSFIFYWDCIPVNTNTLNRWKVVLNLWMQNAGSGFKCSINFDLLNEFNNLSIPEPDFEDWV